VGWGQVAPPLRALRADFAAVADASAADDLEDADGDGVADVAQISAERPVTCAVFTCLPSG
jgi:hypothetical protein